MRPFLLACCSLLAIGCNAVLGLEARPLDEDAATEETSAVADTTVQLDGSDTSIDETAVDDTGEAVDTSSEDTPIDTTAPPDATSPDAAPPDTSIDVAGPGLLTARTETVSTFGSVNLTAEGTVGWGHWGHDTVSIFNHRIGSEPIGRGTVIGSASPSTLFTTRFSWSDGTPFKAATNVEEGIAVEGSSGGFTVDASASNSTVRTLRIYTAWIKAEGTISAGLSDASAPAVMTSTGGGLGTQALALIFTFRAKTVEAKINVKFVKSAGAGTSSVALFAATLK